MAQGYVQVDPNKDVFEQIWSGALAIGENSHNLTKGCIGAASEIGKAAQEYGDKAAAVRGDKLLSAVGKAQTLGDLSYTTGGAVAQLAGSWETKSADEIAKLRAKMAPSVPKDDAAAVALQIELRRVLYDADPLLVESSYLTACHSGADPLLIAAVEGAPAFRRLARPETLEEGKAIRAAREFPEYSQQISELTGALNQLQAAKGTALKKIGYTPDTIAAFAGKTTVDKS